MDQVVDGGRLPLEAWFWEMPVCTRWWTATTILTSVLVQCRVITPYQLFYSFRAVFTKSQVRKHNHMLQLRYLANLAQYWRLLTSFVYFGPLSLDLLIHVYFMQRYSRLVEESTGRSPAKFAWFLFYAMTALVAMSPMVSLPFLGHALSSTIVYIWSRRNPEIQISFFGLMVFAAPYLPWALMAFTLFLHGAVPRDELMGVVIGHVWYFFTDVYPPLHNGYKPLDPPNWWRRLFETRRRESDISAQPINGEAPEGLAA